MAITKDNPTFAGLFMIWLLRCDLLEEIYQHNPTIENREMTESLKKPTQKQKQRIQEMAASANLIKPEVK